jgi:hypothetical protein
MRFLYSRKFAVRFVSVRGWFRFPRRPNLCAFASLREIYPRFFVHIRGPFSCLLAFKSAVDSISSKNE